jgi:hypothetical protein
MLKGIANSLIFSFNRIDLSSPPHYVVGPRQTDNRKVCKYAYSLSSDQNLKPRRLFWTEARN